MNAVAPIEADAIWRPSAALNPQRLDYLWGLAERMAASTIVPESLRGERKGSGTSSTFHPFEQSTVVANVFAVVEQADRWNVSPFALITAAAIVRGKLTFEGKVIAAVLESQFGIKLFHYYRGKPGTDDYRIYLCDEELPADVLEQLKPGYRHDHYRILDGSVGDWKTTGNGSPWRPSTYADMLVYRGTRQWVKVYKSTVNLGVLADDEIDQSVLEHAAHNAIPITQRFSPGGAGFSADNLKAIENNPAQPMDIVDTETGEIIEVSTGAQSGTAVSPTPTGRKATDTNTSAAPASEKPSSSKGAVARDGGGSGSALSNQTTTSDAANAASDEPAGGSQAGSVPGEHSTSHAPLSRDVFRRYVRAIGRSKKEDTVASYTKQFLSAENIGALSEVEKKLFAQLRDEFVRCVLSGKVATDAFLKEAEAWIVADIAEEVL